MTTNFKQLLAGDDLIRVFALGRMPHPLVIELFGLAGGYHGFWFDQEHSSGTSDQVMAAAIAARANQMDCFVRLAPTGYWHVTQCLEAGAGGVMAAQIHTVEQAQQFLSWCRFAPQGIRGLNASGRDADYTHVSAADFVATVHERQMVAIQIETLGAVDAAHEIAALDGVDLLFVGPADLSLALGVVGQFHHDKLWEAISEVAAACRAHGKAWGAVTPDPEFAQRALDAGCRMPTVGNEVLALRRGIAAMQDAFGNVFS